MKLRIVLLSLLVLGTFQAGAFSFLCGCPVSVDEIPQSSWLSLTSSPDGATLELTLTNGAVLISNGLSTVTIRPSGGSAFFRLSSP